MAVGSNSEAHSDDRERAAECRWYQRFCTRLGLNRHDFEEKSMNIVRATSIIPKLSLGLIWVDVPKWPGSGSAYLGCCS